MEKGAQLQKEDPAWEPKVCAFHLSNPSRRRPWMEKFASIPNVPTNLNSSHFSEEVTDFSNTKLFIDTSNKIGLRL